MWFTLFKQEIKVPAQAVDERKEKKKLLLFRLPQNSHPGIALVNHVVLINQR